MNKFEEKISENTEKLDSEIKANMSPIKNRLRLWNPSEEKRIEARERLANIKLWKAKKLMAQDDEKLKARGIIALERYKKHQAKINNKLEIKDIYLILISRSWFEIYKSYSLKFGINLISGPKLNENLLFRFSYHIKQFIKKRDKLFLLIKNIKERRQSTIKTKKISNNVTARISMWEVSCKIQ